MQIERIVTFVGATLLIALAVKFMLVPELESAETPKVEVARTEMASVKTAPLEPSGTAAINRKDDGHYWTTADVDGVAVRFMVDTGASIVALTWEDAERLGLDPQGLDFDSEVRTAGGVVYGARVTLPSIRVGRVELDDVDALVMKEQLDQSLLGMSFLGRLYSYEFRKNQLIIRQ